jgi:hypothetical protein
MRYRFCYFAHRWAKSFILCQSFDITRLFISFMGSMSIRCQAEDLAKLVCAPLVSKHSLYDAKDCVGKWYPAELVMRKDDTLLLHFLFWPGNYDECVSTDCIQDLGSCADDYNDRSNRCLAYLEMVDESFQFELAIAKEMSKK